MRGENSRFVSVPPAGRPSGGEANGIRERLRLLSGPSLILISRARAAPFSTARAMIGSTSRTIFPRMSLAGTANSLPASRIFASPRLFNLHALDRRAGEGVGALVFGVAGMARYPFPACTVAFVCRLKRAPEVVVFHRLFVARPPAVQFPTRHPPRDAIHHVTCIRVDDDVGRFLQCLE